MPRARLVLLGAVLLCAGASWVAAQDARIEEVGKTPVEAKFAAGGEVRMELCSSGSRIVGRKDGQLRVSYNDRDGRDDVRVRVRTLGREAFVSVTGCPSNHFEMTIEIPESSDIHVRMFAGQLDVRDVSGSKDVELHAGQILMDVGDAAAYGRVDASVLSGDLQAPAFDVSKGGLFRSFSRMGTGKYKLHAHIGAGQLTLR